MSPLQPPDTPVDNRYSTLRKEISAALIDAGRGSDDAQLLAVSKRQPTAAIRRLAGLGQLAFGENQVREGVEKMAELADLSLEWHFIGGLQSNKTKDVAKHFDWVHSVDRAKLIDRLADQRPADSKPLNVCIQVKIGDEETKGGASVDDTEDLVLRVAASPRLALRGLMCIPPASDDFRRQRQQFHEVRVLFEHLQTNGLAMDTLSMGMSGDWRAAIVENATLLRIGTAVFGPRR